MLTESELQAAEKIASERTKGKWFFNSYNRIQSKDLVKKHHEWSKEHIDGKAFEEIDFKAAAKTEPDTTICRVPVIAGDTATTQGAKDALAIVEMNNNWDAALATIRELQALCREAIPEVQTNVHAKELEARLRAAAGEK